MEPVVLLVLSTPSLGITDARRRRDLTAIREKSFNSLSRDHLQKTGAGALHSVPILGLSTPSLGITYVEFEKRAETVIAAIAFQLPLSGSHLGQVFDDLSLIVRSFQLPLSGSLDS